MGQYDELLTEEQPSPTPSGKYAALLDDQPTPSKYSSLLDESPPPSDTPETDKAVTSQSRESMRPKVSTEGMGAGVVDVIKGIPGMAKMVAELGYQGAKFQVGGPQKQAEVARWFLSQSAQQGTQLAKDVQSPVGSREWTRGWLQLGMMASPGLELAKELMPGGVKPPLEKPPYQPDPQTETSPESQFTMVEPQPETYQKPTEPIEQTVAGITTPENVSPETGMRFFPERDTISGPPTEFARFQPVEKGPTYTTFGREPIKGLQIGGQDASTIGSTAQAPVRDEGVSMGTQTPLREQGETAGVQESEPVSTGESVATEVSQEPNAPQSLTSELPEVPPRTRPTGIGISQARTESELGKGSVEPGVGAELGSGFDYGRDYINKGGDPRLPIRRALASGLVGKNEVGIVHAELDRLRSERNAAAKALEANPDDLNLQKKLDQADTVQRNWRKELQPVLTKASDALKEAYAMSTPEADPATYEGLSNLLDEHFKGQLDVTPEMRTAMAKGAKGVKEMRDIANKEFGKVEEGLTKQLKGKKVMTPKELDADLKRELETQFKDCVLS